jgi:hypothetical protein
MPPSARAVRPLREEPERVDRAERVLRPLRVDGVRPEGLLPVRAEGLCGKPAVAVEELAGATAPAAAAIPQVSQ